MPYMTLTCQISAQDINTVEQQLLEIGAISISCESADPPDTVGKLVNPTWQQLKLEALFHLHADSMSIHKALPEKVHPSVEINFVGDEDWIQEWHGQLKPQTIGGLNILPKQYIGTKVEPWIHLDPGLAFGSGSHETTALCIEWLSKLNLVNQRVLDMGCGSGILALAASKFGATDVIAIDSDTQAVFATAENAEFNDVNLTIQGNLDGVVPVNVIVANILAETLIQLAPELEVRLEPNGSLGLSGLLANQVDWLPPHFPNIEFQPPRFKDNWALLIGTKKH